MTSDTENVSSGKAASKSMETDLKRFNEIADELRFLEAKSSSERKSDAVVGTVLLAITVILLSYFAVEYENSKKLNFSEEIRQNEWMGHQKYLDVPDSFQKFDVRITSLEKALAAQSNLPKPNQQAINVQKNTQDLKEIDTKLKKLEEAILDKPEKAIALPLMRRDVDDLVKKVDESRASDKAEMDRLYDQQKSIFEGIIGVLITVATGAISLVVKSVFFGPKKKGED